MRAARNPGSRLLGCALLLGAAWMLGGCAGLERLPAVPVAQAQRSSVLDIPDARFQLDDTARINAVAQKIQQRRIASGAGSRPLRFLVISGGGDDGAFGAGLLVGWSARGDRPQFDVVTGVSTGALSAPFAFLGRDHDATLRRVYSESGAGDIFQSRSLITVLAQDGVVDSAPLRHMIDGYVDGAMVEQLAAAYRAGRLLLILTTNLDQGRPVIWNLGAIAESGHPNARELIVNVLL